jgi:phosphoribosylformimino-5-aminoimidazole carboxamide ribotide isomerase
LSISSRKIRKGRFYIIKKLHQSLNIIPSIDLLNNKVVRLQQGDFKRVNQYTTTPAKIAKEFHLAGAKILHVVDLAGAKNGTFEQLNGLKKIRQNFPGILQVGGGIRTLNDVDVLLQLHIDRVVIGSLAIKNIPLTKKIFAKYGPESIVLALDFHMVNNVPYLATDG